MPLRPGIVILLVLILGSTVYAQRPEKVLRADNAPQLSAPSAACRQTPPLKTPLAATTRLGPRRFQLEVARTPEEQQQGLMYRTQLPADRGMVFPFDPPIPARFWMWNTCINLDIVFVYQGRVVYIAANVPPCRTQPCVDYGPPPNQLVDQVVEFNGGTAKQLKLSVGDPLRVEFQPN